MPKPIIIGIDPGTTIGVAVLDTSGSLMYSASFKNAQLSEIITEVMKYGQPILVGTDKKNLPE